MFIIAPEGDKTEPQYFGLFNGANSVIRIKCLKRTHKNSPLQVLQTMTCYLKREGLKESDEAWIVVDKDQWTDEDLAQLHGWSQSAPNLGLAVSNPKFEYWLLLHFEDGSGVTSSNCSAKLKRYLPDYDKGVNSRVIRSEMIKEAIQRAKARDNPPCSDWPRGLGTTVYRLVENILKAE